MKAGRIKVFGYRAGLAIGAGAWLAACASSPPADPLPEVDEAGVAAADDGRAATLNGLAGATGSHAKAVVGFVDALVQLPGYAPFDTTFAFERRALASDDFLRALESELAARGYGLRTATTLGSRNDVGHAAEQAESGEVTRTVAFGPVQMRRRFAQQNDGRWQATSSLFIRGADASRVTLGDEASTPDATAVDRAPAQAAPPNVAPVTEQVPADIMASGVERPSAARLEPTPLAAPAPLTDSAAEPAIPAAPRNVAEIGGSNYAGVFENYVNVDELVLVFPNDSMVIGVENKRMIQEAVARTDPERDLFSLIGCSFGNTAIENGNEVLAIGRANRVKEALIFAGVPGERVLDEGCWAGAPAENFPGRGVVLTIKRPNGTLE